LRVSALESFTESWLIPHLSEFERAHPGIELQVEATLRYADFARDAVDVAIRFGTGPWADLHSEPIVDLTYFPVCSPTLLKGHAPLLEPAALASQTLIHVSQTPDAWGEWLRHAGLAELQPKRAITYDHLSIALSAAETGRGVALSSQFLCEQRLAAGRLCVPFDLRVRSLSTYHLVCRPEGLEDPRITALRDWLVDALE
jgi:LysR family glycine cleavage system transcriptional activator